MSNFADAEIAIVAFGGNLGEVQKTIERFLSSLNENESIEIVSISPLYQSHPLPVEGGAVQPNYTNGVVSFRTALDPLRLLDLLLKLEQSLGRDRENGTYWGPRIIDLDIIAFGTKTIELPQLIVPHPRYRERDFVLMPLKDVSPKWVCPTDGKSIDELILALPQENRYICCASENKKSINAID